MSAAFEPEPEHARLLVAVADELMRVRRDVDGVEALVGDLVRHAPAQDRPAALIQAQALDALNQRLEALSGVLIAAYRSYRLYASRHVRRWFSPLLSHAMPMNCCVMPMAIIIQSLVWEVPIRR